MLTFRRFLQFVILLSACAGAVQAQTIYVDQATGNDANNGLSPGSAVETVTQGFSLIGVGGTLIIGPGIYSPSNGETFPTGAAGNVTVEGAGAGATILDGEGASQVLSLGSAGSRVEMSGIGIFNGDGGIGGGVVLNDIASAVVSRCLFQDNVAGIGGGLHVQMDSDFDVQMDVFDTEFIGNDAAIGGGLQFQINGNGSPTLTIIDSRFIDNTGIGGGIQFQENGGGTHTLIVDRSVFRNNSDPGINFQRNSGSAIGVIANSIFADHPSTAILASDTDLQLVNSTFESNGTALDGIGPMQVINGIFWDNDTEIVGNGGTVSYSIVQDLEIDSHSDGGNNISADPLLDAFQRLTAGSPAIDSGNTSAASGLDLMLDIDHNDRTWDIPGVANGPGGFIDRGAHEFGSEPLRANIPTLSTWSLVLLSLMLGGIGLWVVARRPVFGTR